MSVVGEVAIIELGAPAVFVAGSRVFVARANESPLACAWEVDNGEAAPSGSGCVWFAVGAICALVIVEFAVPAVFVAGSREFAANVG